jgi:sugar O-acyltransferase (sialic acid O-acetyltransferase NeuD family)
MLAYVRDLRAAGEEVGLTGFVDEGKAPGRYGDLEVLGDFGALAALADAHRNAPVRFLTAVGNNRARQQLVARVESLARPNLSAWTLRHPLSHTGHGVEVGEGTCLAPGSIVTTRALIGRHCILNVKASVSHDCEVGDYSNINPGATVCGNVRIGEGCFLGTGATVSNGVSIGAWSVIGAGAVVIRDVPPRVTAVGVPARVIKTHGP